MSSGRCRLNQQLTAEALFRDPDIKGLSSKPKQWFMNFLGEGSICLSMAKNAITRDVETNIVANTSAKKPSKSNTAGVKKPSLATAKMNSTSTASQSPKKQNSVVSKTAVVIAAKPGLTKKHAPVQSKSAAAKNKLSANPKKTGASKFTKAPKLVTSTAKTTMQPTTVRSKSSEVKPLQPTSCMSATMPKKATGGTRKAAVVGLLPPSSIQPFAVGSASGVQLRQESTSRATKPDAGAKIEPKKKEIALTTEGLPAISSGMTVPQLKEEIKYRHANLRNIPNMKSTDLLQHLSPGSVWESHPQSREARKKARHRLHSIMCQNAHPHPLAPSDQLISPPTLTGSLHVSRSRHATCDGQRAFGRTEWCKKTPFRTCEKCDFDLCRTCFELEEMEVNARQAEMNRRYERMAEEQALIQREWEERESSRKRQWEERERARQREYEERERARQERQEEEEARKRQRKMALEERNAELLRNFKKRIRDPPAKSLNKERKLKYTVWTSCGYDYRGPPRKEFNSSFDTIKEANERVEYIFWLENPWDLDADEVYVDRDSICSKGFRRLEVCPDDSEHWTVSAIPSEVYEFLNED